tara:strand:- start:528 stop:1409 length:882 start_codon:yes stop_codon:yes gene_type:complete
MNKLNYIRKGIILAGGSGTRLDPLTKGMSKQLLPVYDKPMIYYPLSILMIAEVQEILIISSKNDLPILKNILGDGSNFGIKLSYSIQDNPNGIAEALLIAEGFLDGHPSVLILGDNLIVGQDLSRSLSIAKNREIGATIFAYKVNNPEEFGIVEFDNNKVISIEEKPEVPKSQFAIPGLYFYDNKAVEIAKKLKPSKRGELEITDLNQVYLNQNELNVELFGRGTAWLDMGTPESLFKASAYIEAVQSINGLQIGSLEEIAFNKGWISKQLLLSNLDTSGKSSYNKYLLNIAK